MIFNRLLILLTILLTLEACTSVNSKTLPNQSDTMAQNSLPPNGTEKRQPPNFAAAAQKLGITEAQLKVALKLPAQPPTNSDSPPPRPDIKGAAKTLGVTEAKLIEALGLPPHPPGKHP